MRFDLVMMIVYFAHPVIPRAYRSKQGILLEVRHE
jgi:hypothetical protein